LRETKLRVVGNFRPGYDGREEELSQLLQNLPLVLPSTHPLSFARIRAASSRRKSTRKRCGSLYTVLPPVLRILARLSPRNLANFVPFVSPFVIPRGIRSEMPRRCRSFTHLYPVTIFCYDVQDKTEDDMNRKY